MEKLVFRGVLETVADVTETPERRDWTMHVALCVSQHHPAQVHVPCPQLHSTCLLVQNYCSSIPPLGSERCSCTSKEAGIAGVIFSAFVFLVCGMGEELLGHEQASAIVSQSAACAEHRGLLNKAPFHALPALNIVSPHPLVSLTALCVAFIVH